MGEQTHAEDLRNVQKGDTVEITTTEGETFETECVERDRQQADPRSGEVRETSFWFFDVDGDRVAAIILDGLKSSPDDPDFPVHNALWNTDEEENLGYIEELRIFGKMEQ